MIRDDNGTRYYYCDCNPCLRSLRSNADFKLVSSSTYYAHRQARDQARQARLGPVAPPPAVPQALESSFPSLPATSGMGMAHGGAGFEDGPSHRGNENLDQLNSLGRRSDAEDPGHPMDSSPPLPPVPLPNDNPVAPPPHDDPIPYENPPPGASLPPLEDNPLEDGLLMDYDDIDRLATLPELQRSQAFIEALKEATLDGDPRLHADARKQLNEPLQGQPEVPANVHAGIDLFLSVSNAPDEAYRTASASANRYLGTLGHGNDAHYPSHYITTKTIAQLSGIYPIKHDMCPNTCMAYTGPNVELDRCVVCDSPRYDAAGTALRTFDTVPLGPQLQALWRDPVVAEAMRYREDATNKVIDQLQENNGTLPSYNDIFCGAAYREAVGRGDIKDDDTVVFLSIDGAQLYESKQSDCWLYVWVIASLPPSLRYKKEYVIPGGFIPGPKKPKMVDSFLFPGLYHTAGLMKEGLRVWDASRNITFLTKLFLFLGLADGPGLTYLNGLAGHSGKSGCRLYCPVTGRRKPGQNHYYPAHQKPTDDYDVEGSNHPDIPIGALRPGTTEEYYTALNLVLQSQTNAEYRETRRITGISRPSLFIGLPKTSLLPLPLGFGIDLMHLSALNIPDLLIPLWRGTFDCDRLQDSRETWEWAVLRGNQWKAHGAAVERAGIHLPSSHGEAPRNPEEKMNSGYRAWEYLIWFYGLNPALLYNTLPHRYWLHFCKLVRGIRLLFKYTISNQDLLEGHQMLVEFVQGFEELYYQGKKARLHFCRQSIHLLLHIAPETVRVGPLSTYAQWLMERIIGMLTAEIRQHSNPYQNISERGLRLARVNAIQHIIPTLAPPPAQKGVQRPLGDGYILRGPLEESRQFVPPNQAGLFRTFYRQWNDAVLDTWVAPLRRWARLELPNGQVVRSVWRPRGSQSTPAGSKMRNSSNIMWRENGRTSVGEVQFFFRAGPEDAEVPGLTGFALVSVYGEPDGQLLAESSQTLHVSRYYGRDDETHLRIIPVKSIRTVVGMVPFTSPPDGRFFLVEKMGLDMAHLGGFNVENGNVENDDMYV